jgi:hypothetical protein
MKVNRLAMHQTWYDNNKKLLFLEAGTVMQELLAMCRERTAERDEARRMYCKAVADHYEYACNAELDGAGPYTQKDVAKDEGWDCFKEDIK